ncbi:hypothetical protein DMI70_18810 [Escherichia coli]|nr:hypothetical protein [Escherichia coli]
MRDTGTAHLMAISGLHIAFAALLAAGLIRGGQVSARVLDPLANAIELVESAVLLYAAYGMQPPALRTVVALAIWGMLKLVDDNGVAGMYGYVVWRQFC